MPTYLIQKVVTTVLETFVEAPDEKSAKALAEKQNNYDTVSSFSEIDAHNQDDTCDNCGFAETQHGYGGLCP